MPLLFVAFQQIDNSLTRTVGGTGMGLPLAKSLTELQGGQIWVESAPGVGSTFSITVPVAPPPVEETGTTEAASTVKPPEETATAKAPQEELPRPTVLAIEEDLQVISLYRRYLSRAGYEVLGVNHTEGVFNMVNTMTPAVILLDVNIDNQAGWDLLTYFKQAENLRDVPVIVCTLNPDRQRGVDMGASAYLVRPFDNDQLLTAIRQAESPPARQRILLVDDKPATVRAFRDALEASGRYEVLEVTNGQEALDVLRLMGTIDLVVLDLRMPGLDGFKVLQALRDSERTQHIPVLVLTAEEVNAAERAILDQIDVYRKDAIDEDTLLDQIAARLSSTKGND
jgi:CheY-like chemotaxis protein